MNAQLNADKPCGSPSRTSTISQQAFQPLTRVVCCPSAALSSCARVRTKRRRGADAGRRLTSILTQLNVTAGSPLTGDAQLELLAIPASRGVGPTGVVWPTWQATGGGTADRLLEGRGSGIDRRGPRPGGSPRFAPCARHRRPGWVAFGQQTHEHVAVPSATALAAVVGSVSHRTRVVLPSLWLSTGRAV
jgi:hypothetical protein